jgi:ABC-type transporter MlaC component
MYVADIIVNGISLANAQRFEFERLLKNDNGDIQAFTTKLEKEVQISEDKLGI